MIDRRKTIVRTCPLACYNLFINTNQNKLARDIPKHKKKKKNRVTNCIILVKQTWKIGTQVRLIKKKIIKVERV